MARVTRSLFARPEEWIHRRVERIYFRNESIAHHQVSVDFTLPRDIEPVSIFKDKKVYLAPLFLLAKDSSNPYMGQSTRFSKLDFTNQEGHSLPLLTRPQSAQLTEMMLREEAERVLGSGCVTGRLQREISAIPYRSWFYLQNELRWLLQDKTCCGDARRKLRKDKLFSELIYTFASHYLIACLLMGNEPRRPIYKLSYDEQLYGRMSKSRGLGDILGKTKQYFVPITEIGASSSYHIEIEIPKELEINTISLVGKGYRWFEKLLETGNRDYFIQQVLLTEEERQHDEGKVYVPDPLPGRRTGLIWVKLKARQRGFLNGALWASFVITVILFCAAFAVLIVANDNEAEAATATLLLVPALVAAYIARPGEHAMTAKMFTGARVALLLNALLPGVGVYMILTMHHGLTLTVYKGVDHVHNSANIIYKLGIYEFSEPPLSWLVLAGLSLVIFLLLSIDTILPQPGDEPMYQIERS